MKLKTPVEYSALQNSTGQETMKNITRSVAMIAVVAALAIGGTVAYFSDTEVSTGNTITAGTIDISVDGQNPWSMTTPYTFANLEPSDDEDINVTLKNEGTNPAVIWKKVSVTAETDSIQSEPECDKGGGTWNSTAKTCGGSYVPVDNISTQFVYSMKIGANTNIDKAWDVKVSNVDDLWIPIGRLDAGASLAVDQNYYFDELAGNEYQGDSMTLDITFYAEQLNAPGPVHTTRGVVLENKNTATDWAPIVGDGTWGILTFDGSGNYTVKAWGLAGASYQVAHYNEATSTQTLMGATLTGVNVSATDVLTKNGADSKYWLRDLSWSNPNTLWEANLVDN